MNLAYDSDGTFGDGSPREVVEESKVENSMKIAQNFMKISQNRPKNIIVPT